MVKSYFFVGIFSAVLTIEGAGAASIHDYPNKPIRMVTAGAGGSSDFVARLIAQRLSANLGQPVIIDNRPPGVIPGEIVSRASPDGYTLLISAGALWTGPLLRKTPYDPVKDFSPVALTNRQPNILVIHPSLPVQSVKELIALAVARPGQLNCGAAGEGGSSHLALELFKAMAAVDIARIPYKGAGPALNDLIGGQLQLGFPNAASATPHVKSGRLRALAVTTAQPSALAPGLPTVAASGVPGYEWAGMAGVFAPAKTPASIIKRLNQEVVRVVSEPDVKQKLFDTGVEAVGSSPEEFGAAMRSEMARLGKVIKQAGIRGE